MGMTRYEVERYAREMLLRWNLHDWRFEWDNAKTRIGQCKSRRKVISLSRPFFERGLSDVEIKDTVLHEIAHALTPGAGHGPKWRLMCLQVGARPERCADVPRIQGNWVATCWQCLRRVTYHRRPKVRRSCKKCSGGRFNDRFELKFQKGGGRLVPVPAAALVAAHSAEPPPAEPEPKVRHWKLTRIRVNTRGAAQYPFQVDGVNLFYPEGHSRRDFTWRVPRLDNPEYDLSGATWEAGARELYERLKGGNHGS